MNYLQFLLIGIGLSMDALAISLCQGLNNTSSKNKLAIQLAITFGFFQSFMTFLGIFIGGIFSTKISLYGNILSSIILIAFGINMLRNSDESEEVVIGIKTLFFLGIATSFDALAIGFSFSLKNIDTIFLPITIIGIVTFIISFIGVYLGKSLGKFLLNYSHYIGGIILILIGLKTLIF